MIRGKKNFLPPCHLILGLGFVFKLEDSSIERHRGERKIRRLEDDLVSVVTEDDQELEIESGSGEDSESEEISKKIEMKMEIINEDPSDFPDTHIKVEHATGKIDIVKDTNLEQSKSEDQNNEDGTIIHAGPMRVKRVEVKQKPQKKNKQQQQQQVPEKKESEKGDKNAPKRGQKGKLKKIREKYKDQDDEERAMMMEILQSSGSKGSQKSKVQDEAVKVNNKSSPKKSQPKENNIEDVEEIFVSDEIDMLDSLTGCPVEEDELLFAIPVVAPYQTLTNYKYVFHEIN